MKIKRSLYKFSSYDAFHFIIYSILLTTIVLFLGSLLFGFSFSSYFLGPKIIIPIVTFIPQYIGFFYNKNGLLEIRDIKSPQRVAEEIGIKLEKTGFVVCKQEEDGKIYDRKSKLRRAIGKLLLEYTGVHYNKYVFIYSRRNVLMRIQMHLKQMDSNQPL